MLGLMQQVAGTPDAMRGKIAYVPQVCCSLQWHLYAARVAKRVLASIELPISGFGPPPGLPSVRTPATAGD